MGRCIECRSKGDCYDWCGISPEEIYDDYENLKLENKKLRECVEFYADEKNYLEGDVNCLNVVKYCDVEEKADLWGCAGKRARQCLKELER